MSSLFGVIIEETETFAKAVKQLQKRFKNVETDCDEFVHNIKTIDNLGVNLGSGVYKVRIANSDKKSGKSFLCAISGGHEIFADKILISVGRKPNSAGIGLERAGVEVENRGNIKVDLHLKTNVDGIYAVGDVTGGFQLTHVATKEGKIAAENIAGKEKEISYRVIPRAVFTSPEIGTVGLTEHQAKEKNIKICTGLSPFSSSSRAYIEGETEGFIKIVTDSETGEILGAQMVGPGVSDLIHEVAVAMKGELLVDDLASTVHVHPTFSESIMEAAEDCFGIAIHK